MTVYTTTGSAFAIVIRCIFRIEVQLDLHYMHLLVIETA